MYGFLRFVSPLIAQLLERAIEKYEFCEPVTAGEHNALIEMIKHAFVTDEDLLKEVASRVTEYLSVDEGRSK